MKMEISEYALLATSRCKKDFSCLRGKKECLCKVADSNGHKTVLIKDRPTIPCSYLLQLGAGTYCLCPTRNEIYHTYRI